MNTVELIYEKSKKLPEPVVNELLHYLEFLENKHNQRHISETVLVNLEEWNSLQETLYVLQNPSLMQQIKASERTFVNKTGFVPSKEQLNALD